MEIVNLTRGSEISQKTLDGQSLYSKSLLKFYDLGVNILSNSLIWKCPSKKIIQLYNENITDKHLEIGPGSGYFLDKCTFPTESPKISLMDLNENPLQFTRDRLGSFQDISMYKADILSPILLKDKFKSIGINYILHCLPGNLDEKSIVFQNLKPLLDDEGVIFGSTILYDLAKKHNLAKFLANFYNKKNIFTNKQDTLGGLEKVLKKNFDNFKLETKGAVGIFVCRGAKNE